MGDIFNIVCLETSTFGKHFNLVSLNYSTFLFSYRIYQLKYTVAELKKFLNEVEHKLVE
jgi:hypothetical protein